MSSEEVLGGTVFRLAKVKNEFPPDSPKPLPVHFRPNPDEKRIAQTTGGPIRASVFDYARTTVPHAQAMRRAGGETVAYGLPVADVRQIKYSNGSRNLRVVRDLLDEINLPDLPKLAELRADIKRIAEMPGAEGHCGIEGLGDDLCTNRRDRKSIRSQLCDIASRLE